MPTFRHGRDTVFKIDDSGGTLRDLSNQLREVSFPRTVDLAETSAYGTFDKTYVVGMRDAKITASGMFSAALATEIDAVLSGIIGQAASVTFEYGPEGSTTGRVRYTGEAYVTSYEISSPLTDMVSVSIELQVTGSVTRNTWP
jgi:predicted secreted protein